MRSLDAGRRTPHGRAPARGLSPTDVRRAMIRLDRALVERGLARSRTQAQKLVVAGTSGSTGSVVPRAAATIAEAT